MAMFKKFLNIILDALFPLPDLSGTQINTATFCSLCRARQARNVKICHPKAYKLAAAASYDGKIKELILTLKYRKRVGALPPLIQILKKYLDDIELRIMNYAVIPIPMWPAKEKQRGFNQAVLIAKEASKILNIPIIENVLVKIRDTQRQAALKDLESRRENIKDCFAVLSPKLTPGSPTTTRVPAESLRIERRHLLIVDDVFTSGSTMNEAVKTLRAAGAKRIIALVIAKTR